MFGKNLCMTLSDIATFNRFSFIIFLKRYDNYMLIIDGAADTNEQNSQSSDVFKLDCVRILFTEIAE